MSVADYMAGLLASPLFASQLREHRLLPCMTRIPRTISAARYGEIRRRYLLPIPKCFIWPFCRIMSSGRPFCRLESVVVNEAPIYRGVFGAHVAQVFRRLNRLGRALRGAALHLCFLHGDGGQPR